MKQTCLFVLVLWISLVNCQVKILYVDGTNGNDNNDGFTLNTAFKTIEQAREKIYNPYRNQFTNGFDVQIRGGDYFVAQPILFYDSNSGSASAPITYRAYGTENVNVLGGKAIPASCFVDVTGNARNLINANVINNVKQCSLPSVGITDLGTRNTKGFVEKKPWSMEVFMDDVPMRTARYPNSGWIRTQGPIGGSTQFTYSDTRKWPQENDLWIRGYWAFDWADLTDPVQSVVGNTITLKTSGQFGLYTDKRFQVINALSELDVPGEYYLDFTNKVLYMYPTSTITNTNVVVSTMDNVMILNSGASYLNFDSITFKVARGAIITGNNNNHLTFTNVAIINGGGRGLKIDGGTYITVANSTMYGLADGAINIWGGDRTTLTSSYNVISSNDIHDVNRWTLCYAPPIDINGVGFKINNNQLHNLPHNAILWGGNDNIVEYNRIYDAVTDVADSGAIYSGKDWTRRGNIFRYNFLYNFPAGDVSGIYMDDQLSSASIYSNIFFNLTKGILIGGGRDFKIYNNMFIKCEDSVWYDSRGLGNCGPQDPAALQATLDAVPYTTPPWSTRYPELASIKSGNPHTTAGNDYYRNLEFGEGIYKCGTPIVNESNTLNYPYATSNFVNAANYNFQLTNNHPAFASGFQRIPLENIGLLGTVGPRRPTPTSATAASSAGATSRASGTSAANSNSVAGSNSAGQTGAQSSASQIGDSGSAGSDFVEEISSAKQFFVFGSIVLFFLL